jgi:hypothetical protein
MAFPYPSYLKQSLGQTLLYKILSHLKNHFFFLQLLKNTSINKTVFSFWLADETIHPHHGDP